MNKIKLVIAKILRLLIYRVNNVLSSKQLKAFEKRLYMAILSRTDIFRWRIEVAKKMGVKIGENCRLYTLEFSTEPYLIEIGSNVVVSSGTHFITHDGGTWVFYNWDDHSKDINIFGKINVGSNCFIGINCIIMPNSTIGDNCIVGAGSVVRGKIHSDSVVMGNPAKVVMKRSLYEKMIKHSKSALKVNIWDTDKKNRFVKEKFCVSNKCTKKDLSSS